MPEPKDGGDKTPEINEDDKFVDDLDDEFGGDDYEDANEDDNKDDSEKDDAGDDDEDDKKSDKKDDKSKSDKKRSSAIVQKQKYREQLRKAQERIKELEGKKDDGRSLSEEERKEKQANEFLVGKIRDVLKGLKEEEEKSELAEEESFQDELDEALESTSFTEDQILDVCEELDISPSAAVKVLKREEKLKGKPKPKMPNNKRGTGDVKDTDKDKKDDKPKSFDEANREAKSKIKQGLL